MQRSSRFTERMALLVTILGTGMVYLDQTAINVALPRIQLALGVDVGGLQWLLDVYILALAGLLLIGGALGDRYGRVRVYIVGMIIFVAASVACGLAGSAEALIAARGAQGVGGALLVPGGLAIINATVAPARRGQMLGTWGTFSPLVVLTGPLVGGWLVDHVSWRAVFFLNIPFGAVACVIAARYVPESRDEQAGGRLDWPGVATLIVGLGGLLFAVIEGPHFGWRHPLVGAALAAGVVGLAAFVAFERRAEAPIMPLGLFRHRTFGGINLVTLILYVALSSVFFFLTLNLQQAQGFSAFLAGLAQLPTGLSLILLSRQAGKLTDRIGPVPLLAAGMLLIAAAFLLFVRPGVGDNYWTTFFPATVVFGLGVGIMVVPLTTVALGALPGRYSGIASGMNNAVSRVAQMLAIAAFGAVMAGAFRGSLTARTAGIALDPGAREQLLAQARNLGATQPPAGLPEEVAEATRLAIRLAFVDGFRLVMLASAGLALVSLGVLLATVRYRPDESISAPTVAEAARSAEQEPAP